MKVFRVRDGSAIAVGAGECAFNVVKNVATVAGKNKPASTDVHTAGSSSRETF
jgi:hypothetical protein